MHIDFHNEIRRKNNILINNIKTNPEPLNNGNLISEFKIENKELIKHVYKFLTEKFETYNENKTFQCLILINILFLTNVENRPAQADRIFLKFIIEKLLKNDKYFKYGLVSFHLFLNRFNEYNIYLFIYEKS